MHRQRICQPSNRFLLLVVLRLLDLPEQRFRLVVLGLQELDRVHRASSSLMARRGELTARRSVRQSGAAVNARSPRRSSGDPKCLRSHHDEASRVHPRALLPAAARKPVARGGRGPGLGRAVPRLERADHRRVLRAQRRAAHPRRRGPIVEIVNNYARISFNFGPTLLLARGRRARRLRRDPRRRPREPRALRRARLGHRAGLQPHDHAARQRARQAHPGALGHRATSSTASAASRRACGCPRRPSTPRRSRRSPRRASASPSSRRTRRSACGRSATMAGRERRRDRPDAAVPVQAALGPRDRPLLLRRPDLAGGRVRAAARAAASDFADRLLRRLRRRRATSRSSSTSPPTARPTATTTATATWRSPTRCDHIERRGRSPADQLRRVPRAASRRRTRSEILENTSLELRPRRRALARRLRLQHRRQPGWNQQLARRRCARRSTGCATQLRRALRARGRRAAARSVGRPRRLHRRRPRPLARERRRASSPGTPAASSSEPSASRALELLEMQRNAMLMYTSCGWFFNELSGIETVQVLHYAARVIQLAGKSFRRGAWSWSSCAASPRRKATFRSTATRGRSTSWK